MLKYKWKVVNKREYYYYVICSYIPKHTTQGMSLFLSDYLPFVHYNAEWKKSGKK